MRGAVQRSSQVVGLMWMSTLDLAWHFAKSIFSRHCSGRGAGSDRHTAVGRGHFQEYLAFLLCYLGHVNPPL